MNTDRIGALWESPIKTDTAPIAKGVIEIEGRKIPVVLFRNRWKKPGEQTPDFHLLIAKDRPGFNSGVSGYGQGPSDARAGQEAGRQGNPSASPPPSDEWPEDAPF